MLNTIALEKHAMDGAGAHRHRDTRVRLATDAIALEALADGWGALACRAGGPTQHPVWTAAYAESFGAAGRLKVMYVGSPENPSLIAPLVEIPGIASRLELIGSQELFEPVDFLHSDKSAFDDLAAAIVALRKPVHFRRIPEDSPAIAAFARAYRLGWVRTVPAAGSPYIELDERWRNPENCFNAGRRSDLRRACRRAEAFGKVTSEIRCPTPEECGRLLDQAYRIEAASWKGECGSALALDSIRGAFFRRFAQAACRAGILRLCFLYIAGEPAAMQIAVEQGERFYLLKIGHDERYARCSPGTLMTMETLKYAAGRGLRSYEFLGNNEDWIGKWTPLSRRMVTLSAYPWAWKGFAALVHDARHAAMRRYASRRAAVPLQANA
jgi:hypothetical protein